MSPRWATVAGCGLHFYAAERHRRPHVDVRRGGEHATVDVLTGEVLAGELPPRVLRAVQALRAEHRQAALAAFNGRSTTSSPVRWKRTRRLRMSDLAPLIDVTNLRILARYMVQLTFADGSERVIDLEPLLWGPMFEPLLADYSLFRQVTADPDTGTIVWPNGADISPRTLFAGSKPTIPFGFPS